MNKLPQISEAEYEIMKVIWKQAPGQHQRCLCCPGARAQLEHKNHSHHAHQTNRKKSGYL